MEANLNLTQIGAHFAGLFVGDGYINRNKAIVFLKIHDAYELLLKYTKNEMVKFILSNKSVLMGGIEIQLNETLCRLKKQKTIEDLTKDEFFHFLRGYIDADGTYNLTITKLNDSYYFSMHVYVTSKDKGFLEKLVLKLKEYGIDSAIHKGGRGYNLYIKSKSVLNLLGKLYKHNSPCLGRRYAQAWAVFLYLNSKKNELIKYRFVKFGI